MSWREDLLEKADSYCKVTGRARSGLGNLIMNDPKFFDRIEEGGGCTVDTLERVMTWFKHNLPTKKRGKKLKTGGRTKSKLTNCQPIL